MNIHIFRKPVYLVRHGQSLYNIDERLGGDPDLSEKGYKFASHLEGFFKNELGEDAAKKGIRIYTSTLKRAVQTASHIKLDIPVISVKNLDEINAGICDGITYKEMEL